MLKNDEKMVISRALLGKFWASIDEKSNTIVEISKREVPEDISIEGVMADLMAVTKSEGFDFYYPYELPFEASEHKGCSVSSL